ncbi:hypothetical protein KAU11_08520 [Candidatus Babeliales bacterium]|nr:hypothetical protein [Candidatus Babeliales bacterium]
MNKLKELFFIIVNGIIDHIFKMIVFTIWGIIIVWGSTFDSLGHTIIFMGTLLITVIIMALYIENRS